MIREIEMRNVKGQTAVQHLTGKDIIIGRNGSGKTTRMQTIGLSMLGYVPGKGKTAADTFKLASDDEMSVRMETDAFSFERTFTKSKKLKNDGSMDVKISQKVSVSPSMGETTNTQKEQRIKKEMGELPIMLDFGAFLSMTDNQQRDFIYGLSGNYSSWNRDRVENLLKAMLINPDMEEANKELYDCMTACIEDTMKQYRDCLDVQAGLLAMGEHAKDKLAYWKKEKITADGASKKLTELKNRGEETDRDLAINLEKMEELQEKKEQIIMELASVTAKNKTLEDKASELQKLKAEISMLEESPDADRINELNTVIAELESEIAKADAIAPDFISRDTELQNMLAEKQEAMRIANEKIIDLKESLAEINAEIKANGDLLQRIQDSHGCCAFSPNIPCGQDFSVFIAETNSIMDKAYDKKDELDNSIVDEEIVRNNLQKDVNAIQQMIRDLDRNRRSHANDTDEKRKQLGEKKAELLEISGREPLLASKKQMEAEMTAYLAENQMIDTTAMNDQKTMIMGQIDSLSVKIDEQKKIRNDLKNIKANIIDSQTAEYNVLCWNQVCTAIGQKGIKGNILKEMLNPLLEDVNVKLHEIGIQEDFFFETNSDTGKEIFEFGWSGKPFAALSTGEQLLLMSAMMTAIIERADPPVKVLALDNINDLDSTNLGIIMRGLHTIGKNLDNIILAGVVEPKEEDSEGWTIWRL